MEKAEQKERQKRPHHSWFLRRQVALEYLKGGKTVQQLSDTYGIPHQSISRWSRDYANDLNKRKERILSAMTTEDQQHLEVLRQQNELLKQQLDSVQTDQELKKENEALKKELEFAQMKARAMEVIMDLAREEYGIDLRKNSGARQPVKSKKTTPRQR
jgi:transposase-like protein